MDSRSITRKTIVWMTLSSLAIGLFWHGWQLATGQIPATSSFIMTFESKADTANYDKEPAWVINLPKPISRGWDPFALPLFIWLYASIYRRYGKDYDDGLVGGLVVGLVGGLVVGLVGGLVVGLVVGLVFGLFVGLVGGLVGGLAYSLSFLAMVGLGWGFLPALIFLLTLWSPALIWLAVRSGWRILTKNLREEVGPAIRDIVVDGQS